MDDRRWETEALRASRSRQGGRPAVSQDRRPVSDEPTVWVTLKEASDATGIPVGTLGSWARRGTVDSYLEGNGGRTLRIVDLNAVRGRAHDLGRPLAPVPIRVTETEQSEVEGVKAPSRQRSDPPPGPGGPNSPLRGEQTSEMMIVPLDAWNKMLNQLGNLHEAGQQLGDARERAAKAETEAMFLRERLAELRSVASPSGGGAEAEAPSATEQSSVASPPPSGRDEEQVEPSGAEAPSATEQSPVASPPPGGDEGQVEPWMPTPVESEPVAEGRETPATVRLWRYLSDGWKSRRR